MTSLELEEDERDRIWAEFTKNGSEIEKLIRIINYFGELYTCCPRLI